MNDAPIHLPKESIHTPVTLFQSHLDGLHALIKWLDGFQAAGKGEVPGHFELIMHYRELRSRVSQYGKEKEIPDDYK